MLLEALAVSERRAAVARHPRHARRAGPPLVPVAARVRVVPPRGPYDVHDTIRTHERVRACSMSPGHGIRPRRSVGLALAPLEPVHHGTSPLVNLRGCVPLLSRARPTARRCAMAQAPPPDCDLPRQRPGTCGEDGSSRYHEVEVPYDPAHVRIS